MKKNFSKRCNSACIKMRSAQQMEPNNPRVILLDAMGNSYNPAMFGGSKEKASIGFKHATEFFAQE